LIKDMMTQQDEYRLADALSKVAATISTE
jgi:hypothetical protein